jgi:large conductance mechanosensitive channel
MARSRNRQSNTQSVTTGTTIRFEEPESSRGRKPKTAIVHEIIPVRGFFDFLREHTVITLAVGFAIATQAQALIKQLISSFIDPLYGLLVNGDKLSNKSAVLHYHGRTAKLGWGAFVYALIDFLFVLLAIYLIVKSLKLDKLEKKAEK